MRALAVILALCAAPLTAQTLNCANPTSQVEATGCAARAYEFADAQLNAAWGPAMARARQMDTYLNPGEVPAADILRDAQRSWITFRDKACEAESLWARGGTLQNQIFLVCLERLTLTRTNELRFFASN